MYSWARFRLKLRKYSIMLFLLYLRIKTLTSLLFNSYYQPNPNATFPFPTVAAINDPVFPTSGNSNSADGWGLRILRSQNILGYGVGLYSFFSNYSTTCSDVANGEVCQNRIFSLEGGKQSRGISMYNLNTIGATAMITRDGVDLAGINSFLDTIALFRSN